MYEDFFGLKDRPFAITPSVDLYFDSTVHRRTLAYLRAGVQQGESLLVMTGEIGAGKTTLLQTLMRELPAAHVVPATVSNTQLDAVGITESILLAFGHRAAERSMDGLVAALSEELSRLGDSGRRGLAIVDEAQNLSLEALRQLLRLAVVQPARGAPLQVLLSGQPGLRARVMNAVQEEGREPVCLFCHVGPLGASETRSYIEHRLQRLGGPNAPRITAGAYEEIQGASGGIPRRINRLCDRLLLAAFLAARRDIDAAGVRQIDADLRQELGDPEATSLARRDTGEAAAQAPNVGRVEADALADVHAKAEAEAEAEPKAEAQAERKAAVDADDRQNAEVEIDADALQKAEVDVDGDAQAKAEVESGAAAIADAGTPFKTPASNPPLRAAPASPDAARVADEPSGRLAAAAPVPAPATPPRPDGAQRREHRDADVAAAIPAVAVGAPPAETAARDSVPPDTSPPDWGAAEHTGDSTLAPTHVGATPPRAQHRPRRALPALTAIVAVLALGVAGWFAWQHRDATLVGDLRGWWTRVVAPSPSVVPATRRDSGELSGPKPERSAPIPATTGRVEQTEPPPARAPTSVVPVAPTTVERQPPAAPAKPSVAQPKAAAPSPSPRAGSAAAGGERPAPAATPTPRPAAAPPSGERQAPAANSTPAPPPVPRQAPVESPTPAPPPAQRQAAPTAPENNAMATPPAERQASAPPTPNRPSTEPAPQAGRSGPACTEAMVALGLCR